jgi:hypothetical protein
MITNVSATPSMRQLPIEFCRSSVLPVPPPRKRGHEARSWSIVRCVDYWLWALENGLTQDPERCQRIIEILTDISA